MLRSCVVVLLLVFLGCSDSLTDPHRRLMPASDDTYDVWALTTGPNGMLNAQGSGSLCASETFVFGPDSINKTVWCYPVENPFGGDPFHGGNVDINVIGNGDTVDFATVLGDWSQQLQSFGLDAGNSANLRALHFGGCEFVKWIIDSASGTREDYNWNITRQSGSSDYAYEAHFSCD